MLSRVQCRCQADRYTRSIWTARTLISSSPASLVSALRADETCQPKQPGAVTLYSLSKNIPHQHARQAREHILSHNAQSVGVLSEVLPTGLVAHLAPKQAPSGRNLSGPFSIAVATYNPRDKEHRVVTFRSKLQGRPNIALGREIKQKSQIGEHDDDSKSDRAFEEFLRTGKARFGEGMKEVDVHDLPELDGVSRSDVKQVTFFSSDRNAPFLAALQKYSGHAQTLGLMASSTPFHSEDNAPFTMYHGQETVSSGAVGIALVDTSGKPSDIQGNVEYSGLQAVDIPSEVTKAQGNIILELEGKNAARLMLDKIKTLPSMGTDHAAKKAEKDKEFYAAIFDRKPTGHLYTNDALHVARIMSGDPSRGALSIQTLEDIKPGYWLTILHRAEAPSYATFDNTLAQINFVSVDPSEIAHHQENDMQRGGSLPEEGDVASVDGFVAASENGIVVGRKEKEPYVTDIDHVVGRTVEEGIKDML